MADPEVAVLVLNFNAGPALEACLKSLAATTYSAARVVILDNGSVDGSLEAARRLGFEVREFGENLGYCAAYNRAFRKVATDAEFVLLSNPDLVVPPPTIGAMVTAAEADKGVGFVGPLQRDAGTGEVRSAGIRWECGRLPRHLTRPVPSVDAVEGAFLLVRRAVIDRVGGLDEALALNLEDVEWQRRAREAGFRSVLVPQATVYHRPPGKARVASGAYYQTRNALYLTKKYCPARALARLARRLRWEGRLSRLLGRPRGPEILRGIEDFQAGAMGMRPRQS